MRESVLSLRLVLGAAWRCDRSASLLALAEALGNVLNRLLPLFLGLIIDGALTRSTAPLVVGAVGVAVALSLSSLLAGVGTHARLVLMERLGQEFDERVAWTSGSLPSLAHLSNPKYQDQIQVLRDRMGSVGRAYNSLINFVNQITLPVTTMIVAVSTDVRLLGLVVVAFAISLTVPLTVRWEERAEEESAPYGRSSEHLSRLFSDPTAGAELRTFRTGRRVAKLLGADVLAWRLPDARSQARSAWLATATSLVYGGVAAVILIAMVGDARDGQLGVGRLVTALLVVGQLRDVVGAVQLAFGALAQTLRTVGRFRWLVAYAERDALGHRGTGEAPSALSASGIDVEHVTFAYTPDGPPALDDVSLHLEPVRPWLSWARTAPASLRWSPCCWGSSNPARVGCSSRAAR
jgi:ATP-binding cassette subfamily B protein